MSAHAWNHRYATGIDSIGVQHMALFQIAREMHHAYHVGKVGEVIPDMNEHRKLMAQVDNLRERYAKGERQVPMELSILVTRWLKLHIKEYDQVFADFLHHRVPDAF